ncbi:MAG: hypothetical protein K6E97_03590 [Treponema sp.]|nr:hypothetical protein [Treponema sp.]
MNEKEKLIELILEDLKRDSGDCEICNKMGWKCRVEIPENFDPNFKADFSKCDFKNMVYKTLTIKN